METKKLTYYDIYGFILAVDEQINPAFYLEYWRFKTDKQKRVDLYVLNTTKKDLPVKLRMDDKGIYIPFGANENTVYYESNVRADWVLYSIEPLIRWKDKCFLHCASVAKDGEAIVFPAAGGVGKTTMAMYLTNKGYEYLSDDWLIVGTDGKAYPFYKTVHVFDYNLKNKEISKKVLGKKSWYYKSQIFFLSALPKLFPHRFMRILSDRLMPIFSVDIQKLHPNAKVGVPTTIKRIYWLKKDPSAKKPYLKKSDSFSLSEKMPYITAAEINHFYKNYLDWAYTHEPNPKIEGRIERDKKILAKSFSNSEIYELFVPEKLNPQDAYALIK